MSQGLSQPDPVEAALAGERAALRVLRRIADGLGVGNELLGELRDVVNDDGQDLPATPRLRSFCRALQKSIEALEGRP
jgi:hypothetical protein